MCTARGGSDSQKLDSEVSFTQLRFEKLWRTYYTCVMRFEIRYSVTYCGKTGRMLLLRTGNVDKIELNWD
jgi:hypothetical protein